ncbi:hypothetical protein VE03_10485 [Pseudogymnoascus sp. 23342-1-I1]|nr:hypothetical protein VE03_10485 [Pseudogymnoascus sp. 23342-1-I1]
MHKEYKRRWRAVKDLRDVYIRFSQAESWHEQYNMQDNQGLEKVWLEYLIALNLEQFDVDVQRAMLTANKRSNELRPDIRTWSYQGPSSCMRLRPQLADEFHFHLYAKVYWLQHIFCISEQESLMYDLLRRLFKGNAVNTNEIDEEGRTPLLLAAEDGHEAIVKSLLNSDIVNIDSKDSHGRTLGSD